MAVALVLCAVGVSAQDAPTVTPLEAKDVEIAALNAQLVWFQEQLDAAKAETAQYRAAYNRLQLEIDRAKRTPPAKAGFTWSWERDEQTGQPKGYVKDTP